MLPGGSSTASSSGTGTIIWGPLCCARSHWIGLNWGMTRRSLEAVIPHPLSYLLHLALLPRSFQSFSLFFTHVHAIVVCCTKEGHVPWVILLAEMNPLLFYWMNRSINKGRIKNYSSKLQQGFPFILFGFCFVSVFQICWSCCITAPGY